MLVADSQYGMYQRESWTTVDMLAGSRYNFFEEGQEKRSIQQPKKTKTSQLLAPPDKDPVMLLNEYGQKMRMTVSTNPPGGEPGGWGGGQGLHSIF